MQHEEFPWSALRTLLVLSHSSVQCNAFINKIVSTQKEHQKKKVQVFCGADEHNIYTFYEFFNKFFRRVLPSVKEEKFVLRMGDVRLNVQEKQDLIEILKLAKVTKQFVAIKEFRHVTDIPSNYALWSVLCYYCDEGETETSLSQVWKKMFGPACEITWKQFLHLHREALNMWLLYNVAQKQFFTLPALCCEKEDEEEKEAENIEFNKRIATCFEASPFNNKRRRRESSSGGNQKTKSVKQKIL